LAYTAKCDTASATKWWITGTGSSVNRLSEVMDDNASGVEENDNPGNYQPWSTFMTETVEDGVYLIHLNLEIGDGSTPTTLTSSDETVWFDDDLQCNVKAAATLTLGVPSGDWGYNGSYWSFGYSTGSWNFANGGTINIYASTLKNRAQERLGFRTGNVTIKMSNLICNGRGSYKDTMMFYVTLTTLNLNRVNFLNISRPFFYGVPDTMSDVHTHQASYALEAATTGVIVSNVSFSEMNVTDFRVSGTANLSVVDPGANQATPSIGNTESNWINEQYTVNITVVDKNGTGIVGATVACAGSDSGTASEEYDTVGFTTADTGASGVLAEQTVTAKKWVGTSATLTNYNYFKFTITEPGYETLVMEKVTIDAPIVWHLELQPIKHPVGIWMDER